MPQMPNFFPGCSLNPPSPLSNRTAARQSQRFASRRLNRRFHEKIPMFFDESQYRDAKGHPEKTKDAEAKGGREPYSKRWK